MSEEVDLQDEPLTTRERAFIAEYFRNGMKIGEAWKTTNPKGNRVSDCARGSAALKRIKQKTRDWNTILEAAGLDDFTLAGEVRKKLDATKSKFYKGAEIAQVADNGTQMRAVELLAELRGRRKSNLVIEEDTPAITIEDED